MSKSYIYPVLFVFLISLGAFLTVNAQSRDDQWNRVVTQPAKAKLVVEHDRGKAAKGRFVRADGDTLTLRTGGREQQFARNDISAVFLGRNSSRVKRAVIGGLAGAGAGFLIGGIATVATKSAPLAAAGGFLIGVPAGAAIGALSGGGMKKGELIYSR